MVNTLTIQDLNAIKQNFVDELKKAEQSNTSRVQNQTSLAYITTQLPSESIVKDDEVFQVQIIGGTLGGNALCIRKNGLVKTTEEDLDKTLPSLKTKDDFLTFVANSLKPSTSVLAVNFAYPLRPFIREGRLDGVLLDIGTRGKAISAPDLIGIEIGRAIEEYVQKKLGRVIRVSVGNDSLCLALAGKNLPGVSEEKLGFGIVGTGVNFGYFINKDLVVNLESHAFDRFPQSELGKELAAATGSPFGKETNGETLYKHFNFFLKQQNIDFQPLTATSQLDEIIKRGIPSLSGIANEILTRSAMLIACQVAGILEYKAMDMSFVMEGGLFWHGNNYKEIVERTVNELTPRKVAFVKINYSNLYGAAKLVG